jgi:hypothetical protein
LLEVTLAAKSRVDLTSGRVALRGHHGKSFGVDLQILSEQIQSGKKSHTKSLEELRQGKLLPSPPERWSNSVLKEVGAPVDSLKAAKLQVALDAALSHDLSLYALAKQGCYDFARHNSDWLDGQQLYYLSDPTVQFVTCDIRRIRHRTRGSSQANRIVSFDELVAMARSANP